ncbi:cell division protein FtsQ/DivIB [Lichenicoccus sp.]|uniref:cell division protein FtsQ/DivIB n=1 Tax=Lichenicoccus sp. TaxID=2781899 RepID=UPI003D119683
MPRIGRSGRVGRRVSKMDRPSRLLIFARRRRGMIRPVLYGVVLLGVAGFGLHVARAMRTPASFAPMRAEIGRDAGLRITDIVVEGRDMEPLDQVKAALGVSRGAPLLGFSVAAARARLERLSFISTASVERRLPGTVLVRLTERRPFAVWQNHDRFVLIDRSGALVQQHGMTAKDADAFAVLPLVVGPGAPAAAATLIAALAAEPTVRKQVVAAVRVGQRRWNLSLRSGAAVLLPEGEAIPALRRLASLEERMHLLERPLIDIDMRLPDRLVVRPRLQASAPADVPSSAGSDTTRRPA